MTAYRFLLTLASLAALLPQQAGADDDWFSQQFKSATPAPAARTASVPLGRPSAPASAPIPALVTPPRRAWRTVVVPAAPELPVRSASASFARPVTAAPVAKALTGYAHELAGLASYYWEEQMTSSGERFDRHGLTAAHKTLPLGTRVRVTNLSNGKSTIVRINDRGPFKPGRIIDLSEAAAQQINMTGPGIARVALDVVR